MLQTKYQILVTATVPAHISNLGTPSAQWSQHHTHPRHTLNLHRWSAHHTTPLQTEHLLVFQHTDEQHTCPAPPKYRFAACMLTTSCIKSWKNSEGSVINLLGEIGVQHPWPLLATVVANCLQPAPGTLNNTRIRKSALTKTCGRHSNTRWLSQEVLPRNARDAAGEFCIAPCSKYASIRNRVLETSPGKMKFVSL